MKRALLLSGGMDSTALAYWNRPDIAVTVDYGQRSSAGEIRAAAAVCEALNIEHEILTTDLSMLGSGDLAGTKALPFAPVPEWWPFRNQLLLTIAAMWGMSRSVEILSMGVLLTDAKHADGTEEFFKCINEIFALQEGNMNIETPAIKLTASELIFRSKVPIDILAWAHSCHVSEYACGMCRGCEKHFDTWARIGYSPY